MSETSLLQKIKKGMSKKGLFEMNFFKKKNLYHIPMERHRECILYKQLQLFQDESKLPKKRIQIKRRNFCFNKN